MWEIREFVINDSKQYTVFFSSEWFRDVGVVLISTGVTLFAKVQSINDRHGKASLNDFAVGLDLMVAAVTLLLARFADLGQNGLRSAELLTATKVYAVHFLFLTFTVWVISATIRAWGWKVKNKLKRWPGVWLPNTIGALLLLYVVHNF